MQFVDIIDEFKTLNEKRVLGLRLLRFVGLSLQAIIRRYRRSARIGSSRVRVKIRISMIFLPSYVHFRESAPYSYDLRCKRR